MKSARKSVLVLTLGIAFGATSSPFGLAAVWNGVPQDTQQSGKAASRLLGTVTAIQGNTLTLKTDTGEAVTLLVNAQTRIVRAAPGQKSLSEATPIAVGDIQIGDRLLSRTTPGEDGKSFLASSVVAMKQSDIAQKQQQDRDLWQRNGIGGLVQAVDTSANTITISSRPTGSLVIHVTPKTILRRYAPDSIEFSKANAAPLTTVKPGDQLRARGTRDAEGKDLTADEVVSGTFRNIAATVVAINPADNSLTLTDLISKKPVTLRVNADSQLHKLPAEMAQMLAMRLKGGARAGTGTTAAAAGASSTAAGAAPEGAPGAGGPQNGMAGRRGPGGNGGDLQQLLNRAPAVTLAELKNGDALMVVSTEGSPTTPASVVMLVSGVEPMFQASTSASQNMFSSSWSLSSGGEGGGLAQ